MTFREIVTWPLRQIDRLNPLSSGAGYMLRHHPTLWRTSVLKIVWYLFVAHLLLWLAGWWVSQSFAIIPTVGEMLSFRSAIIVMAALIGLAWVLSIWQTPLIRRTFGTILLTWVVYAGFIYGLATASRAYFAPVSFKVAQFYDPRYLAHDTAALGDPLAHVCGERSSADPRAAVRRLHGDHPDHDVLVEMVEALFQVGTSHCPEMRAPKRGSFEPTRVPLSRLLLEVQRLNPSVLGDAFSGYVWEVRWYYETTGSLLHSSQGIVIRNAQLDSRLSSVRLAHFTTSKRHHMRYAKSIVQPGMAILAAVLATVLLTVELNRRQWLAAALGPVERMRDRRRASPGLISRVNARFIRTRPVLWQLRLPAAVILMLLVILSGWTAVDFSEWVIDMLTDQLYDHVSDDVAEISIIIVYIALIVGLAIALMQVQRRYFQLDLKRRGAGAQFFLALFLPVLAACLFGSVMTALKVGEDATGNGVVWYAAAVFAYLAATFSWSQTFLGLRSAIILATVPVALSAVIIYVLTLSSLSYTIALYFSYAGIAAVFLVLLAAWTNKFLGIKRPAVVVIAVYGFFWVTVGALAVIEEHFRELIPIDNRALAVNIFFLIMALCLMPLFNRLQQIATAPTND